MLDVILLGMPCYKAVCSCADSQRDSPPLLTEEGGLSLETWGSDGTVVAVSDADGKLGLDPMVQLGNHFPTVMAVPFVDRSGVGTCWDLFLVGTLLCTESSPCNHQLRMRIGHLSQTLAPQVLSRALHIVVFSVEQGKSISSTQGRELFAPEIASFKFTLCICDSHGLPIQSQVWRDCNFNLRPGSSGISNNQRGRMIQNCKK